MNCTLENRRISLDCIEFGDVLPGGRRSSKVFATDLCEIRDTASQIINLMAPDESFYIFEVEKIIEKHSQWKSLFPRVELFFSVKCNDHPIVLKMFASLGTGFDCASRTEMQAILDLDVKPSRIIFANPTKLPAHIEAARSFDVLKMTFDNETELYKIQDLFPEASLLIRLKCDADATKSTSTFDDKFGCSTEEATELLLIARKLSLNVIGVSFHVGTGCNDPPAFKRAIANARKVFDSAKDLGFKFNLLDIGGGFAGNSDILTTILSQVINSSLEKYFPEDCGVKIIAEPGRFCVTSAFTLLTQVHSIRETKGEDKSSFKYYINDGIYSSFTTAVVDKENFWPETLLPCEGDTFSSSVYGQSMDGVDQVCKNVELPKLQLGEWLVFKNMGAYSFVSATHFNGYSNPKVYAISKLKTWNVLKNVIPEEDLIFL